MRWEDYETRYQERPCPIAPGGTDLAGFLINAIDPHPDSHILDLNPGTGILASVLAREHLSNVTCIVGDPESEATAEAVAVKLDVSDRVRVIPGAPVSMPVPSEEFHRIFCLGYPFIPHTTPGLAREVYRVLKPDGVIGFAGPMALNNITPAYMTDALAEFDDVLLRTPAYTALQFSREGFHIVSAEYFHGAWDYWNDWLSNTPGGFIPDRMRKAINEDGGRWLSLGLIALHKPPRPNWAV